MRIASAPVALIASVVLATSAGGVGSTMGSGC